MTSKPLYIHIGCDFKAPPEWTNYEASPFVFLERLPIIGPFFVRKQYGKFPSHVKYGDIVKGLNKIEADSCDGIYCSHVLEHLSLNEFRKALINLNNYLKPGGTFRLIVPDLEWAARSYIKRLDSGDFSASLDFCGDYTYFGSIERDKGIKGILRNAFGTSKHYWMWDQHSMKSELLKAGFKNVLRASIIK